MEYFNKKFDQEDLSFGEKKADPSEELYYEKDLGVKNILFI
jgi:hypothetical protein